MQTKVLASFCTVGRPYKHRDFFSAGLFVLHFYFLLMAFFLAAFPFCSGRVRAGTVIDFVKYKYCGTDIRLFGVKNFEL